MRRHRLSPDEKRALQDACNYWSGVAYREPSPRMVLRMKIYDDEFSAEGGADVVDYCAALWMKALSRNA